MYTRTTTVTRMLIGAAVGLLITAAWAALAVAMLSAVFGGGSNLGWGIMGLALPIAGPLLLCLTRKPIHRALLASLAAVVAALAMSGLWSIVLHGLEHLIRPLPLDRATTLAAVYVAVLLGTTDLLCRRPFRTEAASVFRSVSLALVITFGLELTRNIALAVLTTGPTSEPEWMTWLVVAGYAVLIGANIAYLQDSVSLEEAQRTRGTVSMFFGLNLFISIAIITAGLLAQG